MLKVNVSERLGCLKGGLKDLKRHRWFAGIDWVKLQNKELKVRRVGTAPLPLLASAPLSLSLSLSLVPLTASSVGLHRLHGLQCSKTIRT
jgi:hypothetical protein